MHTRTIGGRKHESNIETPMAIMQRPMNLGNFFIIFHALIFLCYYCMTQDTFMSHIFKKCTENLLFRAKVFNPN